jgi:hypothetical protein
MKTVYKLPAIPAFTGSSYDVQMLLKHECLNKKHRCLLYNCSIFITVGNYFFAVFTASIFDTSVVSTKSWGNPLFLPERSGFYVTEALPSS